jgi:DNA-binding transcriptional MerR regulator
MEESKDLLNGKKVKLTLFGLFDNVLTLVLSFKLNARRQGFSEKEIQTVLDECNKRDDEFIIETLLHYCEDEDEYDEEICDDGVKMNQRFVW